MNSMKTLATLFLVAISASAMAQTAQMDPRIVAKYGTERATAMAEKSPTDVLWFSYWADNGYQIVGANTVTAPLNGSLTMPSLNPADINLLTLPVTVMEFEHTYYTIEGTQQVLVVRPRGVVAQQFHDLQ